MDPKIFFYKILALSQREFCVVDKANFDPHDLLVMTPKIATYITLVFDKNLTA